MSQQFRKHAVLARWEEIQPDSWKNGKHEEELGILTELIENDELLERVVESNAVVVGSFGQILKGIVVATDRRILAVDKGKRGMYETSSIAYSEIEKVSVESGWAGTSIEIRGLKPHSIGKLRDDEAAKAFALYADSQGSWNRTKHEKQRDASRKSRALAIHSALQATNPFPRSLLVKREIKELPKVLWEDELPELLANGQYNDNFGILVATNRRLIFIDKGLFGSLKVEDFDYGKISSIESKTGLTLGEITVYSSGNSQTFKRVATDQARRFSDLVGKKVYSAKEVNNTHSHSPFTAFDPASTQVSIADELTKFAQLREEGIISCEEFDAQKSRLLGS